MQSGRWLLILSISLGAWAQEPQGGQQQAPPTPGGGAAPNVGTTPTTPTPGRFPSPGDRGQQPQDPLDPTRQQRFPDLMQRPIFLSGKVVMEDGAPPPEPVVIERVCNGNARPEGWTDSKGRFSIQLGQNQHMMADASVSSGADTFGDSGFGNRQPSMGGPGGNRAITERDLMGCELRASLAGHRSEVVNLGGRRVMDNPDVGTIILRRLAGVEGLTMSMTSLQAPKDAKKAFEKAREHMKKNKLADAQKELEKAVGLYPKYAAAWFHLGQVHQNNKSAAEARKAYEQAIGSDNKYVSPYLQLAMLAAGEQNWREVADTTARVVRLNPVDFPQAFFYNSVANYNLQNWDESEKSAREAVRLDPQHRMPKALHILGVLLANKDDFKGAAEQMKGYLQHAPQASDAGLVRKQLGEIEKRLGQVEEAKKQ